ncbi:hypothetical protein E8K88_17710 [Lampropedia aestuarii]|uniref:Uncharacterized protein n=1 Tax=Lampropedia aestuarii TaxID=2562762 RepID=A0A4S5BDZ6_9BURK|nr:hypothetical protein [Lampropedia aestuarii]THJ30474.1 hypothetical protein E8K88_17710 [Lampropedia aestuarii]
MTEEDEGGFSEVIKNEVPSTLFIDCYPWPDPELSPRIRDSISQCNDRLNSAAAIWNTDIYSKSEYVKKSIHRPVSDREEYDPSAMGAGLLQFLHSREAGYSPGGLMNASIGYSYDKADEATDEFVKKILKLCKKTARKLYVIDPKTGVVGEKPHSRFFAWPDAIAKYDQVNGMYLTNNTMAYFTSKK